MAIPKIERMIKHVSNRTERRQARFTGARNSSLPDRLRRRNAGPWCDV